MGTRDLKDGYILSTRDGNSWQTFIEATLTRNGCEDAYLSTACRVEFLNGQHPIFGHRFADVRVIKGWEQNHFMRLGAGIHHPFRPALSRELHNVCIDDQVAVKVVARLRDTKIWSPTELHTELGSGPPDNWFFMRISYREGGHAYEMVCPCRYTNFSTPQHEGDDYLQPISGPVLFEDAKGFHIAYVAAHVKMDGSVVAEVIKCVPTYIFDVKSGVGGVSIWALRTLFAPFRNWLLTDEYTQVVNIDADVKFFSYV
ncbi:MAG: hypothetical protein VX700_12305 [Pseudomonadota bacterium]|nr:hypothetical protein [Pseudomonadota bacterium]